MYANLKRPPHTENDYHTYLFECNRASIPAEIGALSMSKLEPGAENRQENIDRAPVGLLVAVELRASEPTRRFE